jgi:purine-binding chemotaxis protein CheW
VRSDFIQGVGKVKGKFVLLLDVDRALSLDEIGNLDAMSAQAVDDGLAIAERATA